MAPSFPASMLTSLQSSLVNDTNQACRAVESWQIKNLKSKWQYFLSIFQLLSRCFEFWLQRVQTVCERDVSRSDLKWNELCFLGQNIFFTYVNNFRYWSSIKKTMLLINRSFCLRLKFVYYIPKKRVFIQWCLIFFYHKTLDCLNFGPPTSHER